MTLREEFEKEFNIEEGEVDELMSFLSKSYITKYGKWLEDKLNSSKDRIKYTSGYNEGYNNGMNAMIEAMKDFSYEKERIINS